MKIRSAFAAAVLILFTVSLVAQDKPLHHFMAIEDHSKVSLAYDWLDVAEELIAKEHDAHSPRPTIGSRMFAIWATSMYDAWAAYDDKAVGSRLGGKLRRPENERTLENKKKAISYASYRSLMFIYPEGKAYLDEQMRKFGYDPADDSMDPAKPAGVGNLAAQAVIDYRRHDGANQFGDEVGGDGTPYGDYTYYKPVNPPDKIIDPDRWQPITFTLKDGRKVTPNFLTPHWYRVKPFAIDSSVQFRPGPPPRTTTDNDALRKEADQVLSYNANLTNQQKAIVEFMRDGPRSTGQSGHWLRFAQDVSRRDHQDLDKDVKLYFVVANVAFDSFISCWETKRYYDSSRPWTLIHYFHKGEKLKGWAGLAGVVHHAAVPRLHERTRDGERRGGENDRALHRLGRLRIRRAPQALRTDGEHRRRIRDARPPDLELHRRTGRPLPRPRRLSHPIRQQHGLEGGTPDRRVELAEVPGVLQRHRESARLI
jgi:hypothetical protein